PAHRIVVGHSCGSDCFEYHMKIATGGSYLGFDRFGLDMVIPDATRVASLARLIGAGAGDRVVVSHDTVWCWLGSFLPEDKIAAAGINMSPLHFTNAVMPQLLEAGVSQAE